MTQPAFFDTETTGLSANDRICQLSAVKYDIRTREFLEEFNEYINPQVPMSPLAQEVTGLTDAFLADKPLFEEVWPRFCDFIAGAEGVAHNAPFDVRMVNQELKRLDDDLDITSVMPKVTDTARLARKAFPGKSVSLDKLPELLGVELPARGAHDAVDDCRRLALLYVPLMEIVGPSLRAQEEIMRKLIGPGLPEDASFDAVVERLRTLDDALAPLRAAEKAANQALAKLLGGQPYADKRIEVLFQPKVGNMDWTKLRADLPAGIELDAYRKKAPAPSMKVLIRI